MLADSTAPRARVAGTALTNQNSPRDLSKLCWLEGCPSRSRQLWWIPARLLRRAQISTLPFPVPSRAFGHGPPPHALWEPAASPLLPRCQSTPRDCERRKPGLLALVLLPLRAGSGFR